MPTSERDHSNISVSVKAIYLTAEKFELEEDGIIVVPGLLERYRDEGGRPVISLNDLGFLSSKTLSLQYDKEKAAICSNTGRNILPFLVIRYSALFGFSE